MPAMKATVLAMLAFIALALLGGAQAQTWPKASGSCVARVGRTDIEYFRNQDWLGRCRSSKAATFYIDKRGQNDNQAKFVINDGTYGAKKQLRFEFVDCARATTTVFPYDKNTNDLLFCARIRWEDAPTGYICPGGDTQQTRQCSGTDSQGIWAVHASNGNAWTIMHRTSTSANTLYLAYNPTGPTCSGGNLWDRTIIMTGSRFANPNTFFRPVKFGGDCPLSRAGNEAQTNLL